MIIYSGVKSDFMNRCEADTIADDVRAALLEKMHRHTPDSEYRAFTNSLGYMYKVLNTPNIPDDAGVAIEYNVPNTAKRVDFLLSGYDKNSKPNVVVVELKQWESITLVKSQDALVQTYLSGGIRKTVHPSYQAWTYAAMIRDYNEYAQLRNIAIHPCACMHNYQRRPANDPIDHPCYQDYLDDAPVFSKGQVKELRAFMESFVSTGDSAELLLEIDHGRIKPSKSLQDSIAGMLKGNQEFNLIDDQKVVYEDILAISRKSAADGQKRVIIVQGGPGTGKSVVAINLLAQLTNEEQFAQYVSKNSAPRAVYSKKLKGTVKKADVDILFKGSGTFVNAPCNSVGTILADEAHRLNEKSGMYRNVGENQIKEIIHAGRCSVFFIDESQRVTIHDIGSVDQIEYWANQQGAEIYHMGLLSQFRCNGSDGYLAWLDNALEIRPTANTNLEKIKYDFMVFDDPRAMQQEIIQKNQASNKARLLAGYCWNWPKETRADSSYHDIKIGDFSISWNLAGGESFAIGETSVNEAGCIHTTQGLEFDYVGIIIGDDMRFEDGHVVTDFTKRASTDDSLKGIKTMAKADEDKANALADEIIKNTYRTLMTRGMKGCYVYCTNPALAEHLRSVI